MSFSPDAARGYVVFELQYASREACGTSAMLSRFGRNPSAKAERHF
jgi:hypothetical protein